MGSPGGYQINPGLYRVPDLLTEDQFVEYMRTTYGVKVSFDYGDNEAPSPARALGRSRPIGPLNEEDVDKMSPDAVNDPILRNLNERNFGPDYASTITAEDEPGVDKEAEVSPKQDAPPIPVSEAREQEKEENKKSTSSASTSSTKSTSSSTNKK